MVELAIRLMSAGGLVLLAGLLGWDSFDSVWKVAACVCFYASCVYALQIRGRFNPGSAGLAACLDAGAIAALLSATGSTASFGFLVLGPIAFAAAKYGSLPSAMAPIAAFILLGVDQWASKGQVPSNVVLGQALGVLAVGLMLNHRRIVVTVAQPVLPNPVEPLHELEAEGTLELRESFRKLKDMYHELERKSRRDRHSADLRLIASGDPVRFHRRLAAELQKLSGAEGLSLYTISDSAGSMVVRALEGSVPEGVRQSTLHVHPGEALSAIRSNSEKALSAFAEESESRFVRNLVLTHRGRVCGLVALHGSDRYRIEESAEIIEEIASIVAELIVENGGRGSMESRLRRAELLFEVLSASSGAATSNSLAARVVHELSELWDIEHIAVSWTDGSTEWSAATHGTPVRPLEAMSFVSGPGLKGWLDVGAPEIVAFDVSDDVRCRKQDMNRQRIQSLALAPIGTPGETLGYLLAASPRSGAIGVPIVECLRMVAAEMHQAVLRIQSQPASASGLTLPSEFHALVEEGNEGCLVYLEPLRKEETLARYGAPAFEIALRQLALRLRSKLPAGGALCRRPAGDYIAYLPHLQEQAARNWANEAAATASLIGIAIEEGRKRVPLAVRAKVARIGVEKEVAGLP